MSSKVETKQTPNTNTTQTNTSCVQYQIHGLDWSICCADTLQVWFGRLWYCTSQHKEDEYRARKQCQEARANRIMQFKVGDYKDSNLKQDVIAGVFKIKDASPCLSPEPRNCPMTCHWMIGMQGSMPCPQCGLMCL